MNVGNFLCQQKSAVKLFLLKELSFSKKVSSQIPTIENAIQTKFDILKATEEHFTMENGRLL